MKNSQNSDSIKPYEITLKVMLVITTVVLALLITTDAQAGKKTDVITGSWSYYPTAK